MSSDLVDDMCSVLARCRVLVSLLHDIAPVVIDLSMMWRVRRCPEGQWPLRECLFFKILLGAGRRRGAKPGTPRPGSPDPDLQRDS